jgi:solute carrier family 13 (sodium-dependent dicarboxylate transporter), member 2/3/5
MIGLVAGPLACAVLLSFARIEALDPIAQRVLAVTAWVAIWWLTEPIPANATALIPFVAFPLLGVMKAESAARAYQHDVIFLFLGGSFLAFALENVGLHRRMASGLIRAIGNRPRRFLAGYLGAVSFTSCWMSNTATTLLFLPPALEIGAQLRRDNPVGDGARRLSIAILIATGLGASVGGMATPIGTAPNMILVRNAAEVLNTDISFASWFRVGVPLAVLLTATLFVTLTYVTCRFPNDLVLARATGQASRWTPEERRTAILFGVTVLAWMTRADLPLSADLRIPGWSSLLQRAGVLQGSAAGFITDGTVAIAAALVLFLLPRGGGRGPILEASAFERMPWGVLVLLGSSFVLAAAFELPGEGAPAAGLSLSAWLSAQLGGLGTVPIAIQLLTIALVVTFVGELASNTAMAALLIPIGFRLAKDLDVNPLTYGFTICLAASCSFMLPVATPPNTLIYGTRLVPLRDMIRTGLVLDLVGALLVASLVAAIV